MKSTRTTTAVLFAALVCAAAGFAGEDHVIPSEQCRGLWLVTLEYHAGQDGGLLLVLDTGAGRSSVDPDSIERVFGRRIRAGKKVTLRDGTAGPMQLHRLKVEVHEMDHLSRALGREIDGILGFPTFKDLLLTLDYHNAEVRVAKGRLPAPDGETVFRDVGKVRPYLALDIGDETEAVLIDSGSAGGFRLDPDDDLAWTIEPRATSASTGYDEIRENRTGRLDQAIRVGPLVAEDPVVRLWDGVRLFGVKVMDRFVWTFDQRKRRIRIVPDAPDPIVSEPERGIGVALRPVAAGFEISAIFGDMPAARTDLRPGDLVVAVDGIPFDDRDCGPAFGPGDRDSVVLTVRRNGADREIEVGVEDLVP